MKSFGCSIMPSSIDMHNDTTNVENDMSNVMGASSIISVLPVLLIQNFFLIKM